MIIFLHRCRLVLSSARTVECAFSFAVGDPSPTEFYTLSLHDALPIWDRYIDPEFRERRPRFVIDENGKERLSVEGDRKSTRLNSSHQIISYAVFCLKKKNNRGRHVCSH